ncbi:MAG: hypothetical protein P8J02_02835 [Yoonia sp.]|nr:hypothetical protein [Yoonia sp.]
MILKLHRLNARFLGLFLAAHLINHLFVALSPTAHIAVMQALRLVYRNGIIEPLLLAGLILQLCLGLALIYKRGKPKGRWAWAQVLSGLYIIIFLAQHVPAVLMARWTLNFDTNIWFASAVVSEMPYLLYFAPYYMLAIIAVFTHLAAALHFRGYLRLARALPAIGGIWAFAVVIPMMRIGPIPAPYNTYLEINFGKTQPNG